MIIDSPIISGSYLSTGSSSQTGNVSITGSLTVTDGITGSIQEAVSASYANFALTSSYSLAGSGFPYSGSAVITGSLVITNLETGSGVRYLVADASGLIQAQTASAAIFVTQQTIATAGQTVFPITNGYSTGYVTVFVNGTKLNASEYTDTSGTNIVLATGSMDLDVVEFQKYLPASGVSNNALRSIHYFITTLGQTSFTVDYTPGLLDVFYNGSKLSNVEYTANNGTSITLATGSNSGDTLEVDVYSYQVGAFSGIGGSGAANQIAFYSTENSISGSNNVTYDGSTFSVTGSFLVTGSSTFTVVGPAIFSGSVTAIGGISGNADSASFSQTASYALTLGDNGAAGFVTTASYNPTSASFSSRTTQIEQVYATTGSNSFRATQSITGSLTVTGQIIAQSINIQQVTSSIIYSSGSNVFGCDINSRQTFTGSFYQTGSIASFSTKVGIGPNASCGDLHVVNEQEASLWVNSIGGDYDSSIYLGYCYPGNGLFDQTYIKRKAGSMVFGTTNADRLTINFDGTACFSCGLTAKTIGTNDLILSNVNYECANYVDGTRGSWLIQEGACDLFIINQISCKKYKFNLIEIK